MAISTHYKQPGEQYPCAVDFTDKLPIGTSIASALVTAKDEVGADASTTVLQGAATVSGTIVTQTIKAGLNGQRYDLKFVATLAAAAGNIEHDVALFVRED